MLDMGINDFQKVTQSLLSNKVLWTPPAKWSAVEFEFTERLGWGASANRSSRPGACRITMNIGLPIQAFFLLLPLLSLKRVLPQYSSLWLRDFRTYELHIPLPLPPSNSKDLTPIEVANLKSHDARRTIISLAKNVFDLPMEDLRVCLEQLLNDKRRRMAARLISDSILYFTFCHELAHISRGHLDYAKEHNLRSRLREFDLNSSKPPDADLTQAFFEFHALEHMADMAGSMGSASLMMFSGQGFANHIAPESVALLRLHLWSFGIALCFLVEDALRRDRNSTYPSAQARIDVTLRSAKFLPRLPSRISEAKIGEVIRSGSGEAIRAWDQLRWPRWENSVSDVYNASVTEAILRVERELMRPDQVDR